MSDMKLYSILETFDKLESATDKLTPYVAEEASRNVNIGVPRADTETIGEIENALEASGIYFDNDGGDNETYNINAGFQDPAEAEQFVDAWSDRGVYIDTETFEGQTQVQTMGNKVRVTKDGDTTEFDDADTAKAMMGADDDENSFATESEEVDEAEEVIDEEAEEVVEDDAEEIAEGGLGGDEWDAAGDALEFGSFDDPYNEIPPEMGDLEVPVADFDADDFASLEIDEACMEDDDTEFATFDSDNESHRKRLQRGTPVVLDPDLFKDPDVNRRGVFVTRSPSGDFAKVVRDFDGKEVKVHLSDIKSADLVNNSVYEEYEINLEAMLAEDITMTQTTNLEQPENDTTTVTAVGAEAGEELAAMMANAGLNGGMNQEPEVVDLGEPVAEPEAHVPAEPGMQDMIGMMSEPEAVEEMGGDELPPMYTPDEDGDVEPSNADLDAIEGDPEWDLDFDMEESADHRTGPAWSKDDFGNPVFDPSKAPQGPSELESILVKFNDVDILAWLDGGNDEVDEALYAISMEDMPYGTQKARTGDPSEWLYDRYHEEIEQYASDNFGSRLGEERDIEHANTPDERTAGVDVVTHGTSGGLNRPKAMHKPAAGGDNAMQRPMEDMYEAELVDEEEELDEALSPEMQARKEKDQEAARVRRDMSTRSKPSRLRGKGRGTGQYDQSVKFKLGEDDEAVEEVVEDDETFTNVHEDVDSFLDMYKEFKIRTDKK